MSDCLRMATEEPDGGPEHPMRRATQAPRSKVRSRSDATYRDVRQFWEDSARRPSEIEESYATRRAGFRAHVGSPNRRGILGAVSFIQVCVDESKESF